MRRSLSDNVRRLAGPRLRALGRGFAGLPVWRWLRDHQKLATILGALSLTFSVAAFAYDVFPGFGAGRGSGVSNASGSGVPPTWPATVANTWSDEKGKDVGTFSFSSPDVDTPHVRSFFQGTQVRVRCGVPDGRLRRTTVNGTTSESPVWYLTSEDDWLPGVFLNVDNTGGPPRQCRPDERPRVRTP